MRSFYFLPNPHQEISNSINRDTPRNVKHPKTNPDSSTLDRRRMVCNHGLLNYCSGNVLACVELFLWSDQGSIVVAQFLLADYNRLRAHRLDLFWGVLHSLVYRG